VGYHLGVDLGTTYTAAATRADGRVRIVTLGTRSPVVPSVVFLRSDGQVLVGEAAARREAAEPDRLAREFKRRMGDQTPILLVPPTGSSPDRPATAPRDGGGSSSPAAPGSPTTSPPRSPTSPGTTAPSGPSSAARPWHSVGLGRASTT
jgi:hypothetical protein